jgi:hypothetical protein
VNWPKFFPSPVKNKYYLQFCDFCGYKKKVGQQIFVVAIFGSEIRDGQKSASGMDKNQHPGLSSRIRNTAFISHFTASKV